MKKSILIISSIIIVILVAYFSTLYINDSSERKQMKESELKLKECYELVKRDIQMNQLNFPAIVDFPTYEDAICSRNAKGDAIITLWVKYKVSEIYNELDSMKFQYSMNDKGEYKLIDKTE